VGIFRKIGWEGVDWMHLAQNKDQWRVEVYGPHATGSGQKSVADSCGHVNEPSGSMKNAEFLDYLLKEDSAPWSW
jgi:hypothetical protein